MNRPVLGGRFGTWDQAAVGLPADEEWEQDEYCQPRDLGRAPDSFAAEKAKNGSEQRFSGMPAEGAEDNDPNSRQKQIQPNQAHRHRRRKERQAELQDQKDRHQKNATLDR